MNDPIYLDHNATTPVDPTVLEAMLPWFKSEYGNPSSGHPAGRRAAKAIAQARHQVASAIGAQPGEIIFTSGGTEASNLAIFGTVGATTDHAVRRIITSTIEHPATSAPCAELERLGWEVVRCPVTEEGVVDVAYAQQALQTPAHLVSIMHANNETGVLQPISAVSAAARQVGALAHTDAAQSLGKVALDVNELGIDLMTIAGHKLYAPKGVGALYVRSGTPLRRTVFGAGHERGYRPGTENVAFIVGLGAACQLAHQELSARAAHMLRLRDMLESELRKALPHLIVHGGAAARLPNTCNFRIPGVRGADLLAQCPEFAASTGSACHEGSWSPSSVLVAMGIAAEDALGAVRLSIGTSTTPEDVHQAVRAILRGTESLCR